MTDTMIDLGEVHEEEPGRIAGAPRPLPWRALLGALSVVLVGLLATSAPRLPPGPPKIIPAELSDATFLDGDRLFLVSPGPRLADQSVHNKLVSAYRLPDGRLLSQTTVAVVGSVSSVVESGGTIVVSYQTDTDGSQATVALTEGGNRALWRRPDGLVGVSGPAGVALLSSGYGARDQAVFSAVDLHTGAVRWQVRQPADGYTMTSGPGDGYPQWFVTVRANGRLETRDAVTGRVTATRDGPPLDRHGNSVVWTVGTMVVVGGRTGGVTAYALPGLAPIWTSQVDLTRTAMPDDCGRVLCALRPQQGIDVLDPTTGRLLWSADRWASAQPAGNYLIGSVADPKYDDPASWVLDPRTGRVLGDFGRWQTIASDPASGRLYGLHLEPGRHTMLYGVLDPATRTVRVLGGGERVFGNCQTSDRALICRLVDASVAIWPLR